jgi:hypothetical protein
VCIHGYCRTNNATLGEISYVQAVFVVPELVPLKKSDFRNKNKNILLDNWSR